MKVWLVSFKYKGKEKKDSVHMYRVDAEARVRELLSNLCMEQSGDEMAATTRSGEPSLVWSRLGRIVQRVNDRVQWGDQQGRIETPYAMEALKIWNSSRALVNRYGTVTLKQMVIR